jgi:ribosomal protein L30E
MAATHPRVSIAIHTAIERGVAVAGAEHTVKSLVIARPERCVVEAPATPRSIAVWMALISPSKQTLTSPEPGLR